MVTVSELDTVSYRQLNPKLSKIQGSLNKFIIPIAQKLELGRGVNPTRSLYLEATGKYLLPRYGWFLPPENQICSRETRETTVLIIRGTQSITYLKVIRLQLTHTHTHTEPRKTHNLQGKTVLKRPKFCFTGV